jgi:pimeloyl-ACP methyl ester carboxylesterase
MLAGTPVGCVTRRQIELDGLRLSYLEQGSAAKGKPSIVLLHGLMGCADTFAPLLSKLSELHSKHHVIALDLPGAGQSERNDGIDASIASTAELIARFVDKLGLRKPMVVGHSHGGAVAMSVAARHPDLLHSMVLLAPAHPWFDEGDPLIRFYLSLPGRMFAYTMPWLPAWLQMFGLRRMAGPKSWDSPERLKPYRDNLRTPGTMAHLLRLLRTWQKDMAKLARNLNKRPLKAPALLIWGDSDRAVPVSSAAELREHLGHSELLVLPGIGHRPAEETPALVAEFLQQWCEADMADLATAAASVRYSANSVASQSRRAALMTPSFEAGD